MATEDRAPGCVFCDIVAGTESASVVLENDRVLAFLDLAQATEGHTLVIPKAHHADIREFDPATGAAVMAAVGEVARALTEAFNPDGLTIHHNIGEAGGQDVFHAHFHVHPRFVGDSLLLGYATAPPHPARAKLDRLAATIREHLPDHPAERTTE